MTITRTTTRWSFTPNGVTTSFPYDNLILAPSDLTVNWWSSNGTALSLPSYSITGVGDPNGGTVVFGVAPATVSGSRLVLERHTSPLQEGNFQDFIQEPAEVREARADRAIALAQEANEGLRRTLTLNPLDPTAAAMVFPPAALRAGMVLGFGADGQPSLFQNVPAVGGGATSAYMQGALTKMSAAELLAYQGFTTFVIGLVGAADAPAFLAGLGFTPFAASLRTAADAAAFRNMIGLGDAGGWIIGTDINAAAAISLDGIEGVRGNERGIVGTTLITSIDGDQQQVRLVAKSDGVKLKHTAGAIVSRTASDIHMRNGDAVTLVRTVANEWRELAFDPVPNWRSGNLAIVNGTLLAGVAHHLGKRVGRVRVMAAAHTDDPSTGWNAADFAAGQRLEVHGGQTNIGWAAMIDDTEVAIQVAFSGLGLLQKAGGSSYFSLDPTKWNVWLEIDPRV